MGRMTNHFLLARDGLPLEIAKRTQGLSSRYARSGWMTYRFLARDGPPLNLCQKLRNEPKVSNSGVPQATESLKLL
jgi:hypothetical protein